MTEIYPHANAGLKPEINAEIEQLIRQHFHQAEMRVNQVYLSHFASGRAIFSRHWRHKRDIPADLAALPRSLVNVGRKLLPGETKEPSRYQSGKQQEIHQILSTELLDLPGLEVKLEQYVLTAVEQYQQQIGQHPQLSEQQQQDFRHYVSQQMDRLHLTNEGIREGLLAFTIMISGRVLGDKAVISSAASIGGTLATSAYLSQQGWLAALWASWMGVPGWVSMAGAGAGVIAALALSPVLAPGFEWGVNRLRARKLLLDTVHNAEQQLLKKDGWLAASRLGVYLQLLPDIAQFIHRLK